MMTTTQKEARAEFIAKIQKAIAKIKVGYCTILWDCVIWRISENLYRVGKDGASITNESFRIEDAAWFIESLQNKK